MSEEVKATETVENAQPVEKKEVKKEASAKKAPKKGNGKKRGPRQGGKPAAAKKPEVFSDSIGDLFPDLAAKLQKSRDERIKQQMKAAQADPKVQAATKKFASK